MIRNWDDFYLNDTYNLEGKRTPKNTECWQVNCGGRALGLENWFCPYSTEEDSDRLFDDWESELSNDERAEETTEWMLKHVPGLRRINSKDDLQPGERLIAYRCSTHDFHFMYMNENGNWLTKQGGTRTKRISEKKVFADYWASGWNVYDSKLILLARKMK